MSDLFRQSHFSSGHGKRQLLQHLRSRVRAWQSPEPFIGGGALFFDIAPKSAVLADFNQRLVRTYRSIRDNPEAVIERLAKYPNEKSFFLKMRQRDIDSECDEELAAWMIYLNRTGFNGLYRVNQKNGFNVPFGRYKNPKICDADNIRACSARLSDVELLHGDFRTVEQVKPGDLYFDPPYAPAPNTASFLPTPKNSISMTKRTSRFARARTKAYPYCYRTRLCPGACLVREGFERIERRTVRSIQCCEAWKGCKG